MLGAESLDQDTFQFVNFGFFGLGQVADNEVVAKVIIEFRRVCVG
jgi:hypothetical protein